MIYNLEDIWFFVTFHYYLFLIILSGLIVIGYFICHFSVLNQVELSFICHYDLFLIHLPGWGFWFPEGKVFLLTKKEKLVLGWRNYMIYNLKDIWVYIYFWLSSFFNHFSRWGFSLRRENYFYYLNKEGKRGFRVTVVYDFTL